VFTFTMFCRLPNLRVEGLRSSFPFTSVDRVFKDSDSPRVRSRARSRQIFALLTLAMIACMPAALRANDEPAALTIPLPGSTFSGSAVTFSWSAGVGASEYRLYVGTKGRGSKNIFASASTTATSLTVSGLPEDGLTIYVRLSSLIEGAWENADYTYIAAGTAVAPVLSSPTPGSILPGSSATFAWSAGVGPSAYRLLLGTTGVDSSNLYRSGSITSTSLTVSDLPVDGVTIYARLYWLMDTTWDHADYQYTAAPAVPSLTGITCQSGTITGSETDTCTVTLTSAAGSGGFTVNLASSEPAVTVPPSVTVAAGATAANFPATVSAVSTAEAITLTATAGTVSKTFALALNAYVASLSINASSIAFGDVDLNTTATQSVTLTSTGAAPVTVSSATISGTGFSFSGLSFPLTLNATSPTATLSVAFDPTTAGAVTGELTVSSNSSTNGTATIGLSGTGTSDPAYEVDVTWNAPTGSADPVATYNIYRSPSGSSSYALMGSVSSDELSYTDDSNIQDGQTYDYIVESVDSSGNESVPSNMASVTIP
jgi:hypothetical protein